MRVIFLFIICFVSLVCRGQEEFTISGTLKGFTDGNIFILKPNGNEWDTLAVARMEKGSFELRGKERHSHGRFGDRRTRGTEVYA